MIVIFWTDNNNYLHRGIVRDEDIKDILDISGVSVDKGIVNLENILKNKESINRGIQAQVEQGSEALLDFLGRPMSNIEEVIHNLCSFALPADVPDMGRMDWQLVEDALPQVSIPDLKRDLHNRLTQMSLITWCDVQRSQNGVTQAIMAVGRDRRLLTLLKRQLIMLYKTG